MVTTRKGKETTKTATNGASRKTKAAPAKATPAKRKAAAVIEETEEPPRKRGEPPLGGETIKISADDQAAAVQLETELLDSAKKKKRATPKKSTTTKPSTKKAAEAKEQDTKTPVKQANKKTKVASTKKTETQSTSNGTAESKASNSDKHFWLMKAEQEDRFETAKNGTINNTKFTIDDLEAKPEPEPWDGVRNVVAAKHMRSMRRGDLAFFYASGGKADRKPGITGIMEVVSESEPDPSVHDEGSYGYVEKASDRDRWVIVKVVFRHKLETPVSLKELQKHQDGALANMQLFKQMRLSVSKVEQAEWEFIMKDLVGGKLAEEYLT